MDKLLTVAWIWVADHDLFSQSRAEGAAVAGRRVGTVAGPVGDTAATGRGTRRPYAPRRPLAVTCK